MKTSEAASLVFQWIFVLNSVKQASFFYVSIVKLANAKQVKKNYNHLNKSPYNGRRREKRLFWTNEINLSNECFCYSELICLKMWAKNVRTGLKFWELNQRKLRFQQNLMLIRGKWKYSISSNTFAEHCID